MQSKSHLELKSQAIQLLKKMGAVNIQEEFRINNMVIDVVGFKNNKIIAVECGRLSTDNKIEKLKLIKDIGKIIHLPYLSCTKNKNNYDYKNKILKNILRLKNIISIINFSKLMKISYPTVLKYCDILEAEGKIKIKDFGNIRLILI